MGALRRWLVRLTESDEARLDAGIRDWADSIPGSVRIAEAPLRQRVKIAGVIRRLTVFPTKDNEALETVVSDGTGEVVVRFTGRRAIGGLTLGTRVVVTGVLGEKNGRVQMLNPVLELTA
jgi:RecG-like helicase